MDINDNNGQILTTATTDEDLQITTKICKMMKHLQISSEKYMDEDQSQSTIVCKIWTILPKHDVLIGGYMWYNPWLKQRTAPNRILYRTFSRLFKMRSKYGFQASAKISNNCKHKDYVDQ